MFLRFVVDEIDPDSGRRRGIIHAAARLRDGPAVTATDRSRLRTLADWFNDHLERPERFNASARAHAKATALSWFKDSAADHLARAWEFVELLSAYGVGVEVLRTKRPGYVAYEDAHQITAHPFADTPT